MTSQNTPPSSSELLPCPFCGNAAEMNDLGDPLDDSFVNCTVCEVQQIAKYTPSHAATLWNTRAKDTPQGDEAAWREGYVTGMTAGGLVNIDEDWLASDTRAALVRSKPDDVREVLEELRATCAEALKFVERIEAEQDTHFLVGGKLHSAIQQADAAIAVFTQGGARDG